MSSQAPALADLVRDAFLAADPGPSDVTDAAAQAVYGHVFGSLRGADDPATHCADACAGLIVALKKHSAPIWHAARGALVGVIHAGVGHHLELAPLIRAVTARLMTESDAVGGDFGAAAQGAVEGSIIAAEELGLEPDELGSVAATAALETSLELAEGSHAKVHHLVNRRVMGFPIRVPAHLRID